MSARLRVCMSGTGTEGLTWVSVCSCGWDRRVCAVGRDASSGSITVTLCLVPRQWGGGVVAGKGGLAHTHREDFGTFEKAASTAPLPSPRQTRWVGRKPEPSEAPVGLTQLHAHYPASPL